MKISATRLPSTNHRRRRSLPSITYVAGGPETSKVIPINSVLSGPIGTKTSITASKGSTELVPGKRVVWLVLDSSLSFIKNKKEWNGTRITFDIARKGDNTEVRFTHVGLVPDQECYGACSDAWGSYIRGSLRSLISKGKGAPNAKE